MPLRLLDEEKPKLRLLDAFTGDAAPNITDSLSTLAKTLKESAWQPEVIQQEIAKIKPLQDRPPLDISKEEAEKWSKGIGLLSSVAVFGGIPTVALELFQQGKNLLVSANKKEPYSIFQDKSLAEIPEFNKTVAGMLRSEANILSPIIGPHFANFVNSLSDEALGQGSEMMTDMGILVSAARGAQFLSEKLVGDPKLVQSFRTLGMRPTNNIEEVSKVRKGIALNLSPDRTQALDPLLRKQFEFRLADVNAAYDYIEKSHVSIGTRIRDFWEGKLPRVEKPVSGFIEGRVLDPKKAGFAIIPDLPDLSGLNLTPKQMMNIEKGIFTGLPKIALERLKEAGIPEVGKAEKAPVIEDLKGEIALKEGVSAGGLLAQPSKLSPNEVSNLKALKPDSFKITRLDRDVTVQLGDKTKNYKKGEEIYIYQDSSTGRAIVKDGDYGVLPKQMVNKVEQAGKVIKPFASELEGVEEVVKSQKAGHNLTPKEIQELSDLQIQDEAGKITSVDRDRYLELNRRYISGGGEVNTKFSQYQLPGGENYREIVHENKAFPVEPETQHFGTAQSWHRVNDRTTPEDKKVYFIEEIQKNKNIDKVKDHPLGKGKYVELELKRALKETVEKGYDYISWTTGEQQIERYPSIRKNYEWLKFWKEGENSYHTQWRTKEGDQHSRQGMTKEQLIEEHGKTAAEKILTSTESNGKLENLQSGGEWAKNLYDRQVPNILKDLTKGQIENIEVGNSDKYIVVNTLTGSRMIEDAIYTKEEAQRQALKYIKMNKKEWQGKPQSFEVRPLGGTQQALKITPEIRAKVIGQPMAGGLPAKITKEDLTPATLESLTPSERELITKRLIEGKSLAQVAKETDALSADWVKQVEAEITGKILKFQAEPEPVGYEQEAQLDTQANTEQLKSYMSGKLKFDLKTKGEYVDLKHLDWLFAKEGDRGFTPDELIGELQGMGYQVDSSGDIRELLQTTFGKQIWDKAKQAFHKGEKRIQQKATKLRLLDKKPAKPIVVKRPETLVGRGTVLNTTKDTDKAIQGQILRDMPFTLLGNKSEVLSRLSEKLKDELRKGIDTVYDLFGGAKGYRVGLFKDIPAENYHFNEFSDERYNYYKNLQDPAKVDRIIANVKSFRNELMKEVSSAFEINIENLSNETVLQTMNKWLQRGMLKERYQFAKDVIQQFGNKLLSKAVLDNFQSPESSAIYYFLENTSIYGISRDANGKYTWTQGIIRTAGDKSTIRNTMARIVNADTRITTELNRDSKMLVTQKDAWQVMDEITSKIKSGEIDPTRTAVMVDPQYLNPTAKEGTYVVGQQDATWAGHKENLETHLLPLAQTSVRIVYTNNEDINLNRWLRANKLPYNVEEGIGIVAEKGGRDEIISLINYKLPKEFTTRSGVDTIGQQPRERGEYLGEEITGESERFAEWLKNKQELAEMGEKHVPSFGQEWTPWQRKDIYIEGLKKGIVYTDAKGKVHNGIRKLIEKYPEASYEQIKENIRKLSGDAEQPPKIPITTDLVPAGFFERDFKTPTPAKLLTSQSRYAELLGLKEITKPFEIGRQNLDLEYGKLARQIDIVSKKLGKKKSEEIAKLLNTHEEAPDTLSIKDKNAFNYFRDLTRELIARENAVRSSLNMEPIEYRRGYFPHIADLMSKEIIEGKYPLPEGLKYWSTQLVGKKVYNPREMRRKLRDDLLEHFSKDLAYSMKSVSYTALKEIYFAQPKYYFNKILGVLSKDRAAYDNLSPEEQKIYDADTTMPASTKKWLIEYVNIVMMGKQTALDESVNLWITDSPIKDVVNSILKPFGKHLSQRPVTNLISQFSMLPIYGVMGGLRPKQLLRNKFQTLQNMALYGVRNTMKGYLPIKEGSTLDKLKSDSLFMKSYSGFEDMPLDLRGKLEKVGLAPYQWSALSNVSQAMNTSFYWTANKIQNPKCKDMGWADPQRTYTEDRDFFYPSEEATLLKEMEYGAHTTQFQYIAMGMPEVFRYKSLAGLTRLQSWWMNHWFIFHREAATRAFTGHAGYNTGMKVTLGDRMNYLKYLIIGGMILNTLGYERSYLLGTAPTSLPPTAQLIGGLYTYYTNLGDSAWEKRKRGQAAYQIKQSALTFIPGYLSVKDLAALLSGDKHWTEYLWYKKTAKTKKKSSLRLLQ